MKIYLKFFLMKIYFSGHQQQLLHDQRLVHLKLHVHRKFIIIFKITLNFDLFNDFIDK